VASDYRRLSDHDFIYAPDVFYLQNTGWRMPAKMLDVDKLLEYISLNARDKEMPLYG